MITYGNMKGRLFLQGAIDNFMTPLADEIRHRIPETPCNIYYDEQSDFYHCVFEINGKKFDVRYYKVFSIQIDGKDKWIGCPRHQVLALVDYIIKEAA